MQDPISRTLRIENLNRQVTQDALQRILETISPVERVTIIENKNVAVPGRLNHGLVKFHSHQDAKQVLHAMDKRIIHGEVVLIHWEPPSERKEKQHYVFVSNLDPDTDNQALLEAFSSFPSLSFAEVMLDNDMQQSLGHGRVAFYEKHEANSAIERMNASTLGSRTIHCQKWENDSRKNETDKVSVEKGNAEHNMDEQPQLEDQTAYSSYANILTTSPLGKTTIKISNLPSNISGHHITSVFQQYGNVSGILTYADRGYAHVKMDTQANAATAMLELQNQFIAGQRIKLSWADDQTDGSTFSLPMPARNTWIQPAQHGFDPFSMRPLSPIVGAETYHWSQFH